MKVMEYARGDTTTSLREEMEAAAGRMVSAGPVLDFTKRIISRIPDEFFTAPASSTGKYHPDFDRGRGGLLRHSLVTATFAKELARFYGLSPMETDVAVAAALVHDGWKSTGTNGSWGSYTTQFHGELGGAYIADIAKSAFGRSVPEWVPVMTRAVMFHMSRWGAGNYDLGNSNDAVVVVVALSDYVASRPFLNDVAV